MSVVMEEEIKRWTARRKSALMLEIIQGKTTVAEASRQYDLTPSEIQDWIDQGKAGMENALRAKPEDPRAVREAAQGPSGSLWRGDAGAACPKKIAVPHGQGRDVIAALRQGLMDDGRGVAQQAVPLVRRAAADRVLQAEQGAPKVKPGLPNRSRR